MRSLPFVLAVLGVACGAAEKPVAPPPCPTVAPAPAPSPVVAASATPSASVSAEPVDPTITRSVIGDAQCLRYAPGYPEYLGLHCALAMGPSGHPEYVFRSLSLPQTFLRVDTAHSSVEGLERDQGLRTPRARIHHLVDCVDDELAKDPKLAGTVVVTWEIGKKGTPEKIKIGDGTLKSKAVNACATTWVGKLHHWPLPEADKPAPKVTFVAAFRTSTVPTNENK